MPAQVEHVLLAIHQREIELVEPEQRARFGQDAVAQLVDAACAMQGAVGLRQTGERGAVRVRDAGGVRRL